MKKLFTILALCFAVVALNAQQARIVMQADNIWGDNTGYQVLLDQDGTASDAITGNFTCGASYAEWEYLIPTNATAADDYVVCSGFEELLIPAGTYDYVILNPGCSSYGKVYVASDQCDPSVGNNYTFEANKTYLFTATLSGQNDCITLTISDGLTGIDNHSAATCNIYPNPATNMLNIDAVGYDNYQITNILGQVVMTDAISNQAQVNVSNLNNGVYFVRLSGDNGVYTQKFIKK